MRRLLAILILVPQPSVNPFLHLLIDLFDMIRRHCLWS